MIVQYIPRRNIVIGGYGFLYNWYAATDIREISSSSDWILPSDSIFTDLTDFLGGALTCGGKLKEVGLTHWKDPNVGATNETGFTFLGAGNRNVDEDGLFGGLTQEASMWSSTEYDSTQVYTRYIYHGTEEVGEVWDLKTLGLCIRLCNPSTALSEGQTGTYTQNDGTVLNTVVIGGVEWLSQNLKDTKYRNGDWIAGYDGGVYTPIADATWAALTTGALCAYNDNTSNI